MARLALDGGISGPKKLLRNCDHRPCMLKPDLPESVHAVVESQEANQSTFHRGAPISGVIDPHGIASRKVSLRPNHNVVCAAGYPFR